VEVSTLSNANQLCTSVTHDRRPCNDRRFGWTRFCWHHLPWAEIGLSAIAMVVAVNAIWLIALQLWTRDAVQALERTTDTAHPAQHLNLPR